MVGLIGGGAYQNNVTQTNTQTQSVTKQQKDIDENKPKEKTPQPVGTSAAETHESDTRNNRQGSQIVASTSGNPAYTGNEPRGSIINISV